MGKAWIISVNMGYGHQRTAFALRDLAFKGKVICANDYPGIPERDRKIWRMTQKGYEFVSRFWPLFFILDQFQKILSFYPKRKKIEPNFQLKQIYSLIKKGWGKHLIERFKIQNSKFKIDLPIITTFFTLAFMAEYFEYPGEIFCVVCDTDIARTWAPFNPKSSKIKYFAPTERVAERLKLYGVKPENIYLTGYPLPQEDIGILKEDLRHRLLNLDTKGKYYQHYSVLIKKYLGELPKKPNHPLTIMFAVGGAGAQKEIGVQIAKSLAKKIKAKKVKLILVSGIKEKVREYFKKKTKGLNVEIIFEKEIENYFQKFNQTLRKTDILWTKPSELSFYTALGLPIIMSPTVGSQEDFNKRWLLGLGSGINQKNPIYTNQWLFDLLDSGWFAEAAMQGFIEGEKLGTLNIKKIISET